MIGCKFINFLFSVFPFRAFQGFLIKNHFENCPDCKEKLVELEEARTLFLHEEEAKDAFSSIHYQWKADASNIVNADGKKLGKINTTNDFCTNPAINWIYVLC